MRTLWRIKVQKTKIFVKNVNFLLFRCSFTERELRADQKLQFLTSRYSCPKCLRTFKTVTCLSTHLTFVKCKVTYHKVKIEVRCHFLQKIFECTKCGLPASKSNFDPDSRRHKTDCGLVKCQRYLFGFVVSAKIILKKILQQMQGHARS